MKKHIKKNVIKMTMMFGMLFVMLVMIIGYTTQASITKSMVEQREREYEKIFKQFSYSMEYVFSDITKLAIDLSLMDDIKQYAKKYEMEEIYELYQSNERIKEIIFGKNFVKNIQILYKEQKIVYDIGSQITSVDESSDPVFFRNLMKQNEHYDWIPRSLDEIDSVSYNEEYIAFIKSMMKNGKITGYVVINLDINALYEYLEKFGVLKDASLKIEDYKGNTILSFYQSGYEDENYRFDNELEMFIYRYYIDQNLIYEDAVKMRLSIVIICVLIGMLGWISIFFVALRLQRPISHLADFFQIGSNSFDEISLIETQISEMIEKNQVLLNDKRSLVFYQILEHGVDNDTLINFFRKHSILLDEKNCMRMVWVPSFEFENGISNKAPLFSKVICKGVLLTDYYSCIELVKCKKGMIISDRILNEKNIFEEYENMIACLYMIDDNGLNNEPVLLRVFKKRKGLDYINVQKEIRKIVSSISEKNINEIEKDTNEFFDVLTEDIKHMREIEFVKNAFINALYVFYATHPEISESEEKIEKSIQKAKRLLVFSKIRKEIISMLIDIKGYHLSINQQQDVILVNRMTEYINKNYRTIENVDEVANSAYVSKTLANNYFKSILDVTIKQFIVKTRLEKSKELLIDSKDNIEIIAKKVGYLNVKSYVKAFKITYCMTPSDFRRDAKFQKAINEEQY